MRRLLVFSLFAVLLTHTTACAQTPAGTPRLVVMNLAAHPDDEDGATLAYYLHAKDAVAYSVIFTRGEGGQNEIGPELYEALGAIRTRETERAARHLGTQVNFLNFKDFGYTKHASEAFDKWGGRDAVTARLVYLIRKLKPDVMFTNHDTVTVGPRRQHGQHQAVGISAYDAFALAADPSFHPEQLEADGVDLWQPKRLFLRGFGGGADAQVRVPVGDVDAATGKHYADYAADALHEHASQGMDRFAERIRGAQATSFTLLRSAVDAPPSADDLAANLPPNDAATPDLSYRIDAGRLDPLPAGTFTLSDTLAVPGQRVQIRWNPDDLPQRRVQWRFYGAADTTIYLSDDSPGITTVRILPDAAPSYPKPVYQYERFTNHPPVVYAVYRAGTEDILAAGYLPLEVAPPVFVSAREEFVRLRPGSNTVTYQADVFDPTVRQLDVNVALSSDAERDVLQSKQLTMDVDGAGVYDGSVTFSLPEALADGSYTTTVTALPRQSSYARTPAVAHVAGRVFDVEVPDGLKVGLVQSYDNTLTRALDEMGVDHVLLDSTALATSDFSDLQTIVIDIRAYLVRSDLRRYNDRLLDWVHQGGHMVVNYQKTYEWNPQYDDPFVPGKKNPDGFAPYPIVLSHDRVTREDAEVTLLQPDHPILHQPNEITADAWKGWSQERGLYFPASHDDRYVELFSLHDPGEAPLRNSTLIAHYGKGTYLYTALVWYRQMKELHPGAFAIYANMLSLPLVDGRAAGVSSR